MNFPMKTVQFTLEFLTPAFLGDATQSGRWRTPPIKALLRQYWRMAYAADKKFAVDVDAMRHEEGRLLGHAWLENDYCEASETGNRVQIAARKSAVRIRLSDWSPGKLKSWGGLEQGKVRHREAQKANFMVGPHAYLGYGPLDGRGGTQFSQKEDKEKKDNAAIQAGQDGSGVLFELFGGEGYLDAHGNLRVVVCWTDLSRFDRVEDTPWGEGCQPVFYDI